MTEHNNGNRTFMKLALAIMAALTLFSSGWAACGTMGLFDARDINTRATAAAAKAYDLETRVTVLEKTVVPKLTEIQEAQKELLRELRRHIEGSPVRP
jgi:hypothetical protein